MDKTADAVLRFWLEEVGPEGWYASDPELDARVRERFEPAWETARAGGCVSWLGEARAALALVVLLDQFPRNMFRDSAKAFSTDPRAQAAAKSAIRRGYDQREQPPARQFFYLPLMHAESVSDQERSVRLLLMRGGTADNILHARAHRDVIRRFARFPFRNKALARKSSPAEEAWLESGGYPQTVAALEA